MEQDNILDAVCTWEDELTMVYTVLKDIHYEEKPLSKIDKKYQKICVHDISSSLKICLNFISGENSKNKKIYDRIYNKKCVPDIVAKYIEEYKEQK